MAINREVVVSSTIDLGVTLFSANRLAALYAGSVIAVLRAPGVGPWQAVRTEGAAPSPRTAGGHPFLAPRAGETVNFSSL